MEYLKNLAAALVGRRSVVVEEKASPVYQEIGRTNRAHEEGARRYEQMASEGYEINPIVRSCINLKATNVSSFVWILKDANGDLVEDHPILDILKRPNPTQSRVQFWEQAVIHLEIGGGMPLHANGSGDNEPVAPGAAAQNENLVRELYTYRPDHMKIKPGSSGFPSDYIYRGSTSSRIIFPVDSKTGNSRVHIVMNGNSLDGTPFTYGTPTLKGCVFQTDVFNEGWKHNLSLIQNGAVPRGAWSTTAPMDHDAFMRYAAELQEKMTGPENAGKSPVLNMLEWKPHSMTPQEMDWGNMMNEAERKIALCFGIPPLLLGIPGDSTFNNMEKALEALWVQTMLPLGGRITEGLNHWFVPMWDASLTLEIDEDRVLALEPLRQAKWDKVASADFLTINEKRKELGFEALGDEEADVLLVPSNLVPLSLTNEELDELKAGLQGSGYSDSYVQAFIAKHLAVLREEKSCSHVSRETDKEVLISNDGKSLMEQGEDGSWQTVKISP